MIDPVRIKFNEYVWHDQPYVHPMLRTEVPKDFHDRENQRTEALDTLKSAVNRKPVILIGERRSGKTSMLRLLASYLSSDPSGRFVPILVPWQGVHSRDVLFDEILQGLCFELDVEIPEISTSRELTATKITDVIRRVLMQAPGKTAVICIDEFDSIIEEDETPREEKSRIMGMANALVESNDLPIKLLFAMSRSPGRIESTRSSPLTAKAKQIDLGPFSRNDCNEMIDGLLGPQFTLAPEDREQMLKLSGGWPYFTKLLLVCLAEFVESSANWLDRVAKKAIAHSSTMQTLENIYDVHFDDHEKAAVLLLTKRDGQLSADEIQVAGLPIGVAAARLVDRHYLRRDGNNYSFLVGFLGEWLLSWPRFEEEVEMRIKDVLVRLERRKIPSTESKPLIVTDKDLEKYGL